MKIKQTLMAFLIAVSLAVVSGIAFDKDATLENTQWLILTLRYFFWMFGAVGSLAFAIASLVKLGESIGLLD